MRFRSTVYDSHDRPVTYGIMAHLFGPTVTPDEIVDLEHRALLQGWDDWFRLIVAGRNRYKRRWLLAYLRDDIITVTVHQIRSDVYEDDEPWEGMG